MSPRREVLFGSHAIATRNRPIDLAEFERQTPDTSFKAQRNLGFDVSGPAK
jgi:hypothetical protein